MVSDSERDAIDEVAVSLGKTRSAVLTRIVTSFIAAIEKPSSGAGGETELFSYLSECQDSILSKGG
jgi:hypothetical protein